MNPSNFYFQYTVDPDADEPIMLIDKHIGWDKDEGYGVMGDSFQRELLVLDTMSKKRIQVWINSPGGIVSDGYNIYNAILKSETKVDTYCTGMAASIAGVIFQAGRNRVMCDYGILMYHNPFGDADDKGLDAIKESIIKMIAGRSGMEENDVEKMMARTSFIHADEALSMGLCDRIEVSTDLNKKRLAPVSNDVRAYWKEASIINNKRIFHNKNAIKMNRIASKLNLNPEASEESILNEITGIQNKKKDLEEDCNNKEKELNDKKDELKKKGDEYDALKKEHDKLKDELDKLKEKMKDDEEDRKEKEETDKEEKAKDKINNYVTEGRIKNESGIIASWIEKYKADPEGVTNLLDTLPVNKQSVSLKPVVKQNGEGKVGSVIANKMSELLAKSV